MASSDGNPNERLVPRILPRTVGGYVILSCQEVAELRDALLNIRPDNAAQQRGLQATMGLIELLMASPTVLGGQVVRPQRLSVGTHGVPVGVHQVSGTFSGNSRLRRLQPLITRCQDKTSEHQHSRRSSRAPSLSAGQGSNRESGWQRGGSLAAHIHIVAGGDHDELVGGGAASSAPGASAVTRACCRDGRPPLVHSFGKKGPRLHNNLATMVQ